MKKFIPLCMILMLFSGCASQEIPQDIPQEEERAPYAEIDGQEYELDNLPENASYNPDDNTVYVTPTTEAPEETIIPDAVDIDAGATSLDSLSYEIFEDRAVITDFNGSETELVIPSHIGDYPVTEIGGYAFEAAWNVTSITLPETITKISEQAFADCESLSDINIPESVTFIGRGAFSNCLSLMELTLPESVVETQEEMLTGSGVQDLYIYNNDLVYNNWGLEEIDCTIHAYNASAILTWAYKNDYPFESLD